MALDLSLLRTIRTDVHFWLPDIILREQDLVKNYVIFATQIFFLIQKFSMLQSRAIGDVASWMS